MTKTGTVLAVLQTRLRCARMHANSCSKHKLQRELPRILDWSARPCIRVDKIDLHSIYYIEDGRGRSKEPVRKTMFLNEQHTVVCQVDLQMVVVRGAGRRSS